MTSECSPFDNVRRDPASFRDPDGHVFREHGALRRAVTARGLPDYTAAKSAGLHARLQGKGLLIAHDECGVTRDGGLVLAPTEVSMLSYPYEWTFGQFKAAALSTLDVLAEALDAGFWLKDASAYNVQFNGTEPVFIDTLSLAPIRDGEGWPGYQQFAKHFLGPLALMSKVDRRTAGLLVNYIDGLPLDLVSGLLPRRTKLSFGLGLHIHAHARAQQRYADHAAAPRRTMSRQQLKNLVAHLRRTVEGISPPRRNGHWADYVDNTNYSDAAQTTKRALVERLVAERGASRVLDLGANTGAFSRHIAKYAGLVLSVENDQTAADANYELCRQHGTSNVQTLVVDVTNPTPAIGWANAERRAFLERARSDVVLALALVHHLAIANNVPLAMIVDVLADLAPFAVVEFVPKEDSQVQRLLASRADIFTDYSENGFRSAAERRFTVRDAVLIEGTKRTMFVLERKGSPA